LASMMKSLMSRYSPEQLKFIVVDLKSSALLDVVDERYILKWRGRVCRVCGPNKPNCTHKEEVREERDYSGLILSGPELEIAVPAVATAMENRSPTATVSREERRNRSWWSGPEVFIFVDDYAMVYNGAQQAFAPIAPYWGNAHEMGVHTVVACPINIANRVLSPQSSLMKLNNDVSASTLIMNGIKENGPIGTVRVEPRPPGRGVLLQAGTPEVIQTPVMAELEATTASPPEMT